MNGYLLTAAILVFLLGLAHSILGERLLLAPLFRKGDLPRLIGSRTYARRTLRLAWHLTTILMWGFGALLVWMALQAPADLPAHTLFCITGGTTLVCAAVALIGSRGRHFSWIVFSIITILIWLGGSLP